jgi:hypothetical protein
MAAATVTTQHGGARRGENGAAHVTAKMAADRFRVSVKAVREARRGLLAGVGTIDIGMADALDREWAARIERHARAVARYREIIRRSGNYADTRLGALNRAAARMDRAESVSDEEREKQTARMVARRRALQRVADAEARLAAELLELEALAGAATGSSTTAS